MPGIAHRFARLLPIGRYPVGPTYVLAPLAPIGAQPCTGMHRTETNMTDGIATDLYRAVAPSPRHGPMPVPTTTARITQAEGGGAVEQPIDGTSLLTRYSRSTRVGRASIL